VGVVRERASAAIDYGFGDAGVRAQGLGDDVLDAWVRRRGFGDHVREVLRDMSARCQHKGMGDHDRRTLLDASPESVLNRRFGKLHVGDLDDAIVVHSGLHHLGNVLDQLVRVVASAAVVDQKNRVCLGHQQDLGFRNLHVKNGLHALR